MKYSIGKVHNYYPEKGYGLIITSDKKYIFLKKDVETKEIKNGDIVIFSGEQKNNKNKAFFVRAFDNKEVITKEKSKK